MKASIGLKLGATFGFFFLLLILSGSLTFLKVLLIRTVENSLVNLQTPTAIASKDLALDLSVMSVKCRVAILAGSSKEGSEKGKKAFEKAYKSAQANLAVLAKLSLQWPDQLNRNRLAQIQDQLPLLVQAESEAMETASRGDNGALAKANALLSSQVTPLNESIRKTLEDMTDAEMKLMKTGQEQLRSETGALVWILWISIAVADLLAAAVALALSKSISRAAAKVLQRTQAIARGDLSGDDIEIHTKDELGELCIAINELCAGLSNIIVSIAHNAKEVASSSEHFSLVSRNISADSEKTTTQAATASSTTEEVNRNLHTVASATEEMSANIQEIAKNVADAAMVAEEAMKTAAETKTIVSHLEDSSKEIGQVTKTISSIAQKTNLLALNATVEAARAGEVGAGFAVVANEVKQLAKQAAAATEEIRSRVTAIQGNSAKAMKAISSISGIIGRVSQISSSIATAVEKHSATTQEIARNLTEAVQGSGQVAESIQGVAVAALNTSHDAADSSRAAQELAELSHRLETLVEHFKLEADEPAQVARRSEPRSNGSRGAKIKRLREEEIISH